MGSFCLAQSIHVQVLKCIYLCVYKRDQAMALNYTQVRLCAHLVSFLNFVSSYEHSFVILDLFLIPQILFPCIVFSPSMPRAGLTLLGLRCIESCPSFRELLFWYQFSWLILFRFKKLISIHDALQSCKYMVIQWKQKSVGDVQFRTDHKILYPSQKVYRIPGQAGPVGSFLGYAWSWQSIHAILK